MSRAHVQLRRRKWAAARRACFARDLWRCVQCGKAGRLEAHHVRPLHRGGDPYDLANLQTLCRGCHIETTAAENRSKNPEREAWRLYVAELSKP